jgi:ubiquinone/menaquinone biosynthesis C-methylase UbiE
MATVFMKWLETSPGDYDRGIRLLTLGRIAAVKQEIAEKQVQAGDRVLEIGCGTGTLAIMMAQRGAEVVGIDVSPAMLAEAEKKIARQELGGQITLYRMEAAEIDRHFEEQSFDVIVSTLVFSELNEMEQRYVLGATRRLLKPGGRLVLADEVVPEGFWSQMAFYAVRLPLVLLTWLLTRTTTTALRRIDRRLEEASYRGYVVESHLAGSLQLIVGRPAEAIALAAGQSDIRESDSGIETCCVPCAIQSIAERMTAQEGPSDAPPAGVAAEPTREEGAVPETIERDVPRIRHHRTLRSVLVDVWALFFRIIPPYPKVEPGLYRVGEPDRQSPVLVTGNFDLTVRRVMRAIDGKVDCWLLVADSSGINVWCAAGGNYFTADSVIAAVRASGIEDMVDHHALILPQLCANGVDGWRIRKELRWGVHWGPARAEDIPTYLEEGRRKTDAMRWVDFPLKDRLEMVLVTLGFYGLLILIPVALFWRGVFWPVAISIVTLSLFYAATMPWLPGHDGLAKSLPLAVIALAGVYIYSASFGHLPPRRLFNWTVGLVGLSVFTGAELQGMSPLMRGEQANWTWEAVIGFALAAVYWLVPHVVSLGG